MLIVVLVKKPSINGFLSLNAGSVSPKHRIRVEFTGAYFVHSLSECAT